MNRRKGSINALVVEDEIKIGNYMKDKIEYLDAEFTVQGVAQNGRQALEIIKESRPQVVFTDICMPVMDGLELSRLIRNRYPEILVVIISGYSDFEYAQKAIQYGVFNYILKPLEDEKLFDVLIDIRRSLMNTGAARRRDLICSDQYMLHAGEDLRYALFFVCVGNWIYDVRETELAEYYEKELAGIPWETVLKTLCGKDYVWYAADEQAYNQKTIGIWDREYKETPAKLAGRLMELIGQYTKLAVHIVLSENPIEHKQVYNRIKHFRFLMQKKLIVGKPQIIIAEQQDGEDPNILEIVKMKMNRYIRDYFISADLKNFSEEIQTILQYMIRNNAAWQEIEKVSLYVIKLLEFSDKGYRPEFLREMERRLQLSIGMAETEEELNSRMMECFREIGSYMERLYEKNLEARVIEYVDHNFLTLESLEQVADVFGYNYTYLSRLFKKISGVPLNKYITEKKMETAKHLLEKHPQMRVEEVCEMCGYHDGKYFGRVFKSQTGMTPSEYRKMHCHV